MSRHKWTNEEVEYIKRKVDKFSNKELSILLGVKVLQIKNTMRTRGIKRKKLTTEDRFWKFVDKKGEDECWEWTGAKTSGYGELSIKSKPIRAHRISWEIHYGPIPKGKFICHHCDNRSCVNPKHLFLGTQSDNMQDCMKKGRFNRAKGMRQGKAKLTDKDVLNIRKEYIPQKISRRVLAEKYRVSSSCIQAIVERRSWKHLK